MHLITLAILATVCCCLAPRVSADDVLRAAENQANLYESPVIQTEEVEDAGTHTREKRTLFLKKKLIGAGLLGFGLGIAKGYKAGYYSAPEVHHVYLSPPPSVKYVEYVEKPIFVERPAPVFKAVEKDTFSPYGAW